MNESLDQKITLSLLLDKLSSEDRDILLLWFVEGYNLKEVAQIINERYKKDLGSRVVGLRIHKIIKELRTICGITINKGDLYKRNRLRK